MTTIEADTTRQPETLQARSQALAKELKDLHLDAIVKWNDENHDLEFLEKFGDHPDNFLLWHEDTGSRIEELGFMFKDMDSYAKRSNSSQATS